MRGIILACAVVAACDSDPPVLQKFTPETNDPMLGIGYANVHVQYSDESDVTVTLLADGHEVEQLAPMCSGGNVCTADTIWDNTALPAGVHMLGIKLEDSHGNTTKSEHALDLQDVLDITSMRVTNIVDQSGALEIEAYAFTDDSGTNLIGCAGSRQRLDIVDYADTTYQTEAILIDPAMALLSANEMGAQRYRIEVWEDDDPPVCPTIPDPAGNDLLGASPAYTVDEWRQMEKVTFGKVTELGTAWTRPLHTGETPGTTDPTHDFNGFGGGCSSGRPTGFGALLGVLALVTRRRRWSRAGGRADRHR